MFKSKHKFNMGDYFRQWHNIKYVITKQTGARNFIMKTFINLYNGPFTSDSVIAQHSICIINNKIGQILYGK